MSNFFPYLNYILKKEKKAPDIPKYCSFMSNRWLSMASNSIAQIVNVTSNRWSNFRESFDDEIITKFYFSVIPKHFKRIEYIKKSTRHDEDSVENIEYLSNSMELSRKEIEKYHKTLEELNLLPK